MPGPGPLSSNRQDAAVPPAPNVAAGSSSPICESSLQASSLLICFLCGLCVSLRPSALKCGLTQRTQRYAEDRRERLPLTDTRVVSNLATADRGTRFRRTDDRSAANPRIPQLQLHKLTAAPDDRSQLNMQSTPNTHPGSHGANLDKRVRRSMQFQNPAHN